FVGIERFGVEQSMRDHVLLAHGIFDVSSQEFQIEQVSDAQAAAAHLVFVGRTDAAGRSANLHAAGRVFGSQFDHAVVGKNHLGAVTDKQRAIHLHAHIAKTAHFFQKGDRVEYYAITDHAGATGAQNAARHQLQDEFLAIDDDRVAGIV